jgi:2-iminobutanoate/2-iminopropanoate deaminase
VKQRTLNAPTVAAPQGNYSLALEVTGAARVLWISGQVPEASDGEVPGGFEPQCRQVWANLLAALESAEMTADNLVKVTTYLTDRSQAEANGRIRREVLGSRRPALRVVVAQTLDPRWLLEIEAVAMGA